MYTSNAWTIKSANKLHLQMEQHISVFLQKQNKTIETIGIRINWKNKIKYVW